MKALVISGGGSKGAFAGGVAEYLIKVKQKKYDIFVGSSVGSILISHLALNKIELLKYIFTHVSNKDIYNIMPFRIIHKKGQSTTKINHLNTIKAFLKGSSTFGESKNLRQLIQRFYTPSDFEQLKKSSKIFFTVSNITQQKVEYFYANQSNYDDFCDMMWASANLVPFMSLLTKNGNQYADGGFGAHIPVMQAISQGATEIDVIILDKEIKDDKIKISKNPFETLMGIFKFMANQSSLKDILLGKLQGIQSKIDIKLWFAPEKLTENALNFNTKQMTGWWQQGFEYARKENPVCHCFLPNGKVHSF